MERSESTHFTIDTSLKERVKGTESKRTCIHNPVRSRRKKTSGHPDPMLRGARAER